MKYPIIIIATSNDSEIPIDAEKTFVEKISMNHLEQDQRRELLFWLIDSKGLKHEVDVPKIAKMCSDYVLADFEALVSHAIKNRFKLFNSSIESSIMELSNSDFIHAYGKCLNPKHLPPFNTIRCI